ncbi:MAG: 1-(5-phosphoribosyl)-5-[(5-phosphoribosylamino)methylideneamino]imidazole-4-carboxamide isomerase [Candidatus Altiarchaeota archaeon]|nr:1-(5-phosphoribosyl)-5-[(5-phosphoribosylamino)methylideneamino]imidazole-4-carboxamide isomerase [Candidatus Altiarchaeota archaeon]
MKVIPAIDIMDDHCVQLIGGEPGTEEFFGDPVEIAMEWVQAGAEMLHVIDLDAALGTGDNLDTVLRICRTTKLPVHFGGGIRDYERAQYLLDSGIDRIILGTMAFDDYRADFFNIRRLGEEFGTHGLIVALDSRGGRIVVDGWQKLTELKATEFVERLEGLVWGFLYTDVDVEGRMQGINLERIRCVVESTAMPVIVSGGISSIADLEKIKETGAWGVVLGKALYVGGIDLREALALG